MQMRTIFVALALSLAASSRPTVDRRAAFDLKNGQDAIALNDKFKTLTANSPCQAGENACINQKFAQCANGKFVVQACAPGTICSALPLVNKPGTTITCTTKADAAARIAATGAQAAAGNNGGNGNSGNNNGKNNGKNNNGNNNGNGKTNNGNNNGNGKTNNGSNNAGNGGAAGNSGSEDPQTSLTLDPDVIAEGFANDGQDQPTDGQVASLTSTNNFINFCKTVNLPLTNGQQIRDGSCNPAPMGAVGLNGR